MQIDDTAAIGRLPTFSETTRLTLEVASGWNAVAVLRTGDTVPRVSMQDNGISFGSGSAAADTFLQRSGAGVLRLAGSSLSQLDVGVTTAGMTTDNSYVWMRSGPNKRWLMYTRGEAFPGSPGYWGISLNDGSSWYSAIIANGAEVGIGGNPNAGHALNVTGASRFTGQITSTVSTGTGPVSVASTTVCTNLNSDLLDGQHGSYYTNPVNESLPTSFACSYDAVHLPAAHYLGTVGDALAFRTIQQLEYWNGSAWVAWTPDPGVQTLLTGRACSAGVSVTSTNRKWRFVVQTDLYLGAVILALHQTWNNGAHQVAVTLERAATSTGTWGTVIAETLSPSGEYNYRFFVRAADHSADTWHRITVESKDTVNPTTYTGLQLLYSYTRAATMPTGNPLLPFSWDWQRNITSPGKINVTGSTSADDALRTTAGRLQLGQTTGGAGIWLDRSSGTKRWFLGLNGADSDEFRVYSTTGASNVLSLTTAGALTLTGAAQATRFVSTVATGTSPIAASSTTLCTNLNADLLDGYHASSFALSSHSHAWSDITSGKPTTVGGYGITDVFTKAESDNRYSLIGHTHPGVYEPAFSKGDLVQGSGVTLSGTLTGRLIGSGNVTVTATGITDHGSLTGLADDDHPHYHTDSRGDARYLRLTGGNVTGNVSFTSGTTTIQASSSGTPFSFLAGWTASPGSGGVLVSRSAAQVLGDIGAEPTFSKGNIIAGGNVSFTGSGAGRLVGSGDLIINASGSVTSVGLSAPDTFTVSGSPVTGSGTLGIAWSAQTANKVLASPDGASGGPSFRPLVAADIPNLDAAKITAGTLGSGRLSGSYGSVTGVGTLTSLTVGGAVTLSNLGADVSGSGYKVLVRTDSNYAIRGMSYSALLGAIDAAPSNRGIPAGGSTGQALIKSSASDYAVTWGDVSTGLPALPSVDGPYVLVRASGVFTWRKLVGDGTVIT